MRIECNTIKNNKHLYGFQRELHNAVWTFRFETCLKVTVILAGVSHRNGVTTVLPTTTRAMFRYGFRPADLPYDDRLGDWIVPCVEGRLVHCGVEPKKTRGKNTAGHFIGPSRDGLSINNPNRHMPPKCVSRIVQRTSGLATRVRYEPLRRTSRLTRFTRTWFTFRLPPVGGSVFFLNEKKSLKRAGPLCFNVFVFLLFSFFHFPPSTPPPNPSPPHHYAVRRCRRARTTLTYHRRTVTHDMREHTTATFAR